MADRTKLLVTTTTFPRWTGDSTPGFIEDLTKSYSKSFEIRVLAPHHLGSDIDQKISGFNVTRYRYFFPYKSENIVYDGGGVSKIKNSPQYLVKLLFLILSQSCSVIKFRLAGYKIIHAHWIIPQGIIAVLISKVISTKVIISVHGSDISTMNGRLFRYAKRFALKHAHAVTVNSSHTKDLCESIYLRNYDVIPMGIDTSIYNKSETYSKRKNAKEANLLFVGRLTHEKGIDILLESLLMASPEMKFKLVLAGSGPKENDIKAFATKYELEHSIEIAGWADKKALASLYHSSDILIAPSIREAQGIAVIEALSCGLPVITSGVGGISDAVQNGVNGVILSQNNPKELAAAIVDLWGDKKKLNRFSINAQSGIDNKYSWKNIGNSFTSIIKN